MRYFGPKVVPVYKNDDKPEPDDYRSISLLSIFNRIFEKLKGLCHGSPVHFV